MSDKKTYRIEAHPTLPIMMTKFEKNFVFMEHGLAYSADVKAFLDQQTSPVFYVFDLTEWHLMSFDEMMTAAAQAAKGKQTNFHHPMNRYTLIITDNPVVSMSAEGMTSSAYDQAQIKVFGSVDEAINFAKSELR